MSNNDRSKWDYFFDMNLIEFLNTVVFYKEKKDYDNEQIEMVKREYGN